MPSTDGERSASRRSDARWSEAQWRAAQWAVLSSRDERVITPADPAPPAPATWPQLASSGERLAAAADLLAAAS